jgi:hypothetical protein
MFLQNQEREAKNGQGSTIFQAEDSMFLTNQK